MKTFMAVIAMVLILGASTHVPQSVLSRKCTSTPVLFPDAPEPAFVLDGSAVDEAAIHALDRSQVESIEIVCAEDLYRVFAVKAQRSGIVVFTAPGPQARLRASLDSITRLQNAYFKEHGAFAGDVGELGWSDPSITIELRTTDGGRRWTAVGSHRFMIRTSSKLSVSGSGT